MFFSLAASLLPSGSAGVAVGFGGYVGSSRLDTSFSSEESSSSLVRFSFSFLSIFINDCHSISIFISRHLEFFMSGTCIHAMLVSNC